MIQAAEDLRQSTLRDRPFRDFWLAASSSALGDGLRSTAIPLLAVSISREPGFVAAVSVANLLPWAILGLFGGAVADRSDALRIMRWLDAARFAVVSIFVLSWPHASTSRSTLLLVLLALTSAQVFHESCAATVLPRLVPPASLASANIAFQSSQVALLGLLGPPLGSLLFVYWPPTPFLIDGITFGVSGALLLRVGIARRPSTKSRLPLVTDIRLGLTCLRKSRELSTLCALLAIVSLVFSGAQSVMVLYALEVLHLSGSAYGLVLSLAAAGGLFASIVLARLGDRFAFGQLALIAAGAQGCAITALGFSDRLAVAGGALFIVGAGTMLWNTSVNSFRQLTVPPDMLGRVTSVFRLAGIGTMPVGAALAGLAASAVPIHAFYLIGGLTLVGATAIACPAVLGPRRSRSQPGVSSDDMGTRPTKLPRRRTQA